MKSKRFCTSEWDFSVMTPTCKSLLPILANNVSLWTLLVGYNSAHYGFHPSNCLLVADASCTYQMLTSCSSSSYSSRYCGALTLHVAPGMTLHVTGLCKLNLDTVNQHINYTAFPHWLPLAPFFRPNSPTGLDSTQPWAGYHTPAKNFPYVFHSEPL